MTHRALTWLKFCLASLCIIYPAFTQEEYKPLKLDEADEIENVRVDGKDILKARGHVRFSQDTLTARSDQAAFFRDEQTAILIGNVVLFDQHRTIYCEKARYYAKPKKAVCEGNVFFIDKTTTLVADSLVYFQKDERLFAEGSVVIFDSSEAFTIYGREGFYDAKKKYATAKGNPYLVQFDSTKYKGQNIARMSRGQASPPQPDSAGRPVRYKGDDQLTAKGLFVEAFMDSHVVFVRDSVFVTREKLVTTSGLARYHTRKELLLLRDNPVSNYETSTMYGDSMTVQFDKREIKTIDVSGKAIAESDADSSGSKQNRLRAKTILMFVDDKQLSRMEAAGNAYNLYYLESREGVNEISGPKMTLFFDTKGKLSHFRVHGGAEGTFFPEKFERLIKGRE